MPRTSILFVCLGNICRSPMAKVLFIHKARARGVLDRFTIDSCGTGGWHAGGPADPRTIACAARHGVPFEHTARQVRPAVDFDSFDFLLAMDCANRDDLLALGAPPERVKLMRSFDPGLTGSADEAMQVPDPYLGGPEGFDTMFTMLERACDGLLDHCLETRA